MLSLLFVLAALLSCSDPASSSYMRSSLRSRGKPHEVLVTEREGGKVFMERSSFRRGEDVVLTVACDEGYAVSFLEVRRVSGGKVFSQDGDFSSARFMMVDEDVMVSVVFEKILEE